MSSGDFNIKVSIDAKKILADVMDYKTLEYLGDYVVTAVKANTEKGISSVEGGDRRFAPYASQRNKDPNGYPGKLKPKRPVNLHLSGEMLNSLTFKAQVNGSERSVKIYFDNNEMANRYLYNHVGSQHVPPRRALPILDGEKFSVSIQKAIDREIDRRVKEAVQRTNSK